MSTTTSTAPAENAVMIELAPTQAIDMSALLAD